jgi:hypothetical protein
MVFFLNRERDQCEALENMKINIQNFFTSLHLLSDYKLLKDCVPWSNIRGFFLV